jgi:hypothetical protein
MSNIEQETLESNDLWIPEFGLLAADQIDLQKKYQGRIYRLSTEAQRVLPEIVGFTAKFDSPTVRSAYVDVFKTEGFAILEIDRNTKPTDVSLRYMRDRWHVLEVSSKGADALRPWVRTDYDAAFLPEQVFHGVAEQLRVKADELAHFYVRLNFRDRIVGIITEEQYAHELPTGAFEVFSLPSQNVNTVPVTSYADETEIINVQTNLQGEDMEERGMQAGVEQINEVISQLETSESKASESPTSVSSLPEDKSNGVFFSPVAPEAPRVEAQIEPKPAKPYQYESVQASREARYQASRPPIEPQAKYATYSKSEVDQMLKQQTESITSALSGKVSSQQRLLQEAIANQEKNLSKITDKFLAEFEQARVRQEASNKSALEISHKELEQFRQALNKELDQHRAQINKNVIPLSKTFDEKLKALQEVSKQGGESIKPVITRSTGAIVVAVIIAAAIVAGVQVMQVGELKQQVSDLTAKVDKLTTGK